MVVSAWLGLLAAPALAGEVHAGPCRRPASVMDAPPVPLRALDVLHYDLDLTLDPVSPHIDATARLEVAATVDDLGVVQLDLIGLSVEQVRVEGAVVLPTYDGELLDIPLLRALDKGEQVEIEIDYSGSPQTRDGLGLFIRPEGDDVAWTMAEPDGARRWFPCNDTPADKATLSLTVAVEPAWTVAGNGLLTGTRTRGALVAYTWASEDPLSTYLMAFTAGPYVHWSEEASGVPLEFYARPEYQAMARSQWEPTARQLTGLSEVLIPYPFQKYGITEAPMAYSGMEHQTLTLWGTKVFDYGLGWDYESLGSHELAHHWFGDLVSPLDWREIWLNEGFATYSEALWKEVDASSEGEQAAREALLSYMQGVNETVIEYIDREDGSPLYDPYVLFGLVVYERGASTLHMLRYVVGGEVFFEILRTWLTRHSYGVGTTAAFVEVAEEVSGQELSWFFDPWVYASDVYPVELEWGWQSEGDTLYLGVAQRQVGTQYNLPLPIKIVTRDGRTLYRHLWLEEGQALQYALPVSGGVAHVHMDPDGWLLATQREDPGMVTRQCDVVAVDPLSGVAGPLPGEAPPTLSYGTPCGDPNPRGCDTRGRGHGPSLGALLLGVVAWRVRRGRGLTSPPLWPTLGA